MHICIKSFIIFVSIFSVIEVSADTIDINKEIDLYALSQKYPKCTSSSYRDECYDLSRGKGFTHEGYWREYRMRQATKSNINIDNTPNYTPSSSFCTGSTYGNNFSVSCY